jgi:hypothetical protein
MLCKRISRKAGYNYMSCSSKSCNDYRVKNISDDKTYRGIETFMDISNVDECGELISPQWTEEDESYYKSVLWHVSNSISNGKETNVKSDLTAWLEKLKNRLSN